LRFGGAYSTSMAVALENSPPADKPCNTRASTINSGAAIPISA